MPDDGPDDRTLLLLAETSAALKRALAGERTWVERSVLRDSWEFCQARGIPNPANPYEDRANAR